jgi:hypothetical protein
MATSGALAPFLQAMLGLRSQRLQEAGMQQEQSNRDWSALASGISSAAGSIGGAIGNMGQNAMANTAMNMVNPPRATAVGPNADALNAQAAASPLAGQIPYSQQAANVMGPHTGGMKEAKLMDAMGQFNGQKPEDLMKKLEMELKVKRYNDQRTKAKEADARKDVNSMTKQSREIFTDSKGYLSGSQMLMEKIAKAGNRDEYMTYANELAALNSVHEGRNLKTPLRQVPPFVSPEDKAAMQGLEEAQRGAQGQPTTESTWGGWGPNRPTATQNALLSAQQGAAGRGSSMADYRAITQPGASPPQTSSAGGGGGGAIPIPEYMASRPDGATAVGPGGRRYVKRGNMLVPQ